MKKKSTIIAIIILVVAAIAFGVMVGLMLTNKEKAVEGKIIIKIGESETEYDYSALMERVGGEVDFQAVYKRNGKVPVKKTYSGIELKAVFAGLNIDTQNAVGIRFTASDGLENMYPMEDVLMDGNVYIARLVEGIPFEKGILANGADLKTEDGGEFVVIKALDNVSQNRVRCMIKLEVCFE